MRVSCRRVFYLPILFVVFLIYQPDGIALPDESKPSEFFRVLTGQGEPVTLTVSRDGWLIWTNAGISDEYIIERAHNLNTANWSPIARGQITNAIMSVKVLDHHTPEGMVFIPGGTFLMGNTNDASQWADPMFLTTVSPFYMNRYEVTLSQYTSVIQWAYENGFVVINGDYVQDQKGTNLMVLNRWDSEVSFASNRFDFRPGREQFPAHYVSWYGAVSICNWFSVLNGLEPCYDLQSWDCDSSHQGFRLPTEAEWEFAARGGYQQKRFPWGHKETITHSDANYRSETNNWYDLSPTRGYHPDYADLRPGSSPVGTFPGNNFGLHDMSGNVWEWTGDWWARYSKDAKTNPSGAVTGMYKVFRGGAWRTTAERTTCAVRYISARPGDMVNDVGFRLVISYGQ